MPAIPLIARRWLIFFGINAVIIGFGFDYLVGNRIDYWIHDPALVYQARLTWKYTGVVVLDQDVPIQVSRKQALPLYALAVERLIGSGAKGVFLDARLSKENEGIMPFAVCIEESGEVRWSQPNCSIMEDRCLLSNSDAGNAPLKMSSQVFPFFRVAPYLQSQADLPDFLLYDWENEAFIPETGLEVLDRLVTKNTPIARWIDISDEHASIVMAKMIDRDRVIATIANNSFELCDQNSPCLRIRLSYPQYKLQLSADRPIIPVSKLASCNQSIALEVATLLEGRVAVLQLTTLTEATDSIITPMTTALLGPYMLTPGAQFIADSIETLLNEDAPREPAVLIKVLLFLVVAIAGVIASVYLKQLSWLWVLGALLFGIMVAFCFFMPVIQLWPVTSTILVFLVAVMQMIALHLWIGFKEGQLILQYMPKQVHGLLFNLSSKKLFSNQRREVIVLMSDLKGYTTITGMLEEPEHILNLMNDYLEQTTYILQEKYQGWLETYIGDMVCYYWPYDEQNKELTYKQALLGAIELSQLQQKFFSDLKFHYQGVFDIAKLNDIQQVMDAGIGLASGSVVMGDLGPKRGVRKFGILGDPMNLTSRIEGLTRYFNTQIIISDAFLMKSQQLGLLTRRLGCFRVKGRNEPVLIYALGTQEDPRFQPFVIKAWEEWLALLESNSFDGEVGNLDHAIDPMDLTCPQIFQKDYLTITRWYYQGLLKKGIWSLNEK